MLACVSTAFFVWLNNTPLYKYATFIYLFINGWTFLAIMNNAPVNIDGQVFVWICVLISLEFIFRRGIVGSYDTSF